MKDINVFLLLAFLWACDDTESLPQQGALGGASSSNAGQGGKAGSAGEAGVGGATGNSGQAGSGQAGMIGGGAAGEAGSGGAGQAGEAGSGGQASGAVVVKQLCQQVEGARCEAFAACGCPLCEDGRVELCEVRFASAVAPLDAGTILFHPERLQECREAIKTQGAGCGALDGSTLLGGTACADMLVDTAELGALCHSVGGAFLCAEGKGFCLSYLGEIPTCTKLGGEGEDCPLGACAPGLVCLSGTCQPPQASGSPCTSSKECTKGLVCSVNGKCAAPGGEGATCSDPGQCAPGLTCLSGSCAPGMALDASCIVDDDCGAERTCLGEGSVKVCLKQATLGEVCVDFPGSCSPGLHCVFQPEDDVYRCVAPGKEGEPCAGGVHCEAGLSCRFSEQPPTCQAAPAAGEPCQFEGPVACGPGLGCAQGTCVTLPVAGVPCLASDPPCAAGAGCNASGICEELPGEGKACLLGPGKLCAEGLFCDFTEGRCRPQRAAGSPCNGPEDCVEGLECGLLADPLTLTCYPPPTTAGSPCDGSCGPSLFCKPSPKPGSCKRLACAATEGSL